jgi:hypothetical protein
MSKLFCETCTAILTLKSIALVEFDPAGCQLLTTTSHNFEDSARQGCALCLLLLSVLGERKVGDMRQRFFENLSLPEDKKYETIFTLFSYGSNQLLLEVSQKKRGEARPQKKRNSVIRPPHSGIMLLSPGKLII